MRILLLLLFVMQLKPLFPFEEKELVVPLTTQNFLATVSVSPLNGLALPEEYLTKLRDLLLLDINKNGSFFVDTKSKTDFHIDLELVGKDLSALIKMERKGVTKSVGPYPLCGIFSSDRRLIHMLHDELSEIITGKRGIASKRILFAIQFPGKPSQNYPWHSEIWESDYDGENLRQITKENSYCISPVFFSSEGRFTKGKFMYVNYKKGQPKIYISSLDSSCGESFLPLRGNQLLPTLSQKGDVIAFICDASGRADLFIQLLNQNRGPIGKPIQVFSYPKSVQSSPTFRPDGKKIAFVSDKDGTPHIFLIDTPYPGREVSTHPRRLTKNYSDNTCPAWSPDGTKLAYSAKIDGIRQIVVYDFLIQKEIPLTRGPSHKENPAWAPNSFHIIYNTVDGSSSELYIVDLKHKEPLKITSGPGRKHYPTWEPTRGPL